MPQCLLARLQAEHVTWYELIAMQLDQAMHGSNELHVRIAPTHHLRNGQLFQRVSDNAGKHVAEVGAGHLHGVEERFGFSIHALRELWQLAGGNALGFQFLQQSRGRVAIGAQSHADRH